MTQGWHKDDTRMTERLKIERCPSGQRGMKEGPKGWKRRDDRRIIDRHML